MNGAVAEKSLLIIIPAYNEEKNVGPFLEELSGTLAGMDADILVIDDASTDRTARIAEDMGCTVVTNIYNLGYGSGLQTGYKYASKHGYDFVIQMDADGQHDACNIDRLYQKLLDSDEAEKPLDIVLGSRFLKDSVTYPVSLLRKIGSRVFRFLIRLGTGQKITDPTTGLQGLSRRVFSFYAGYNHFDDKYPDANMLMQVLLLGFRVEEIPAVMHPRTEGVSMHSGLNSLLYMFRMTFSVIAVWIRVRLFHVDEGIIAESSGRSEVSRGEEVSAYGTAN